MLEYFLLKYKRIRCNKYIRILLHRTINFVKVCGLLRVGTNYLSKLLIHNFKVIVFSSEELCWKHGPILYDPTVKYIIIVKDPYSWILSFKKWEEIHMRIPDKLPLEDFILGPLTHKQLAQAWSAQNPLDVWNKAMRFYLSFIKNNSNNTLLIRYEDLITKFDEVLVQIEKKLSLKRKLKIFKNIPERADNWKTPKPRSPFNLEYYLNKKYISEFTPKALEIMKNFIDPYIIEICGYQII